MKASIRLRRMSRGFTLIEIVVVMAIVSVLASIAVPTFSRLGLRTKQAERDVIMTTILQNVRDFYVHFGTMPGGDGVYVAGANPALPLSTMKRSWSRTMDATWQAIFRPGDEIQGALYHAYSFQVTQAGDDIWLYVQADGNLDGAGGQSQKWVWFHHPPGGAFEAVPGGSWDSGPDVF